MSKVKILLVFATVFLIPSIASADIPDAFREFVTHGEFNEISNAFERVALVFSDSGFERFMTVFFLAGVFVWLAMAVVGFRMFNAVPQIVLMQSAVYIMAGVLIYIAFIQPKTEIAVYDSTTNQHMIVADMPQGVALIAGAQSLINEAIIDMIWTSSEPDSYLANAGGDIFNILTHAFDKKRFIPSVDDSSVQLLNKSIQEYWVDCSVYAINGPTGGFDLNVLHDGSMSTVDILGELQNGAQYTTTYLDSASFGKRATCTEAFGFIESELNNLTESGTGEKFWQERCGAAGYYDQLNATGTPAVDVCKNKTIDFLATQVPGLSESMALVRQYIVSSALQGYIKKNDIISHANYKIMTAATGEAASASNWVPVIKGVVFAVYIGLIPFLLLLLPTMLCLRVLQFLLGIFVFMICWSVCDSILHSYAMDRSIAMLRDIFDGANNLSLLDIWLMRDESMRALVLFGKMRWTSMMLAAVVSAVIAKYGGVALAHFAGQMNFSGLSSQASNEIYDPESRAHDLQTLPKSMPTEAVHNKYGASAMARDFMLNQEASILTANKISEYAGDKGAANQMADIGMMQHRGSVGDVAGREKVENETGWRPEDVAAGKSYVNGLGTIGGARAATDLGPDQYIQSARLNSDIQAMHSVKTSLANRIANDSFSGFEQYQAMTEQAMINRGGVVEVEGSVSNHNPVLESAFNSSGPVTIRPITDEQKENVARFLNSASDSHVNASEVADTTTMNLGYHDGKLAVTDATGVEGFHATTYHGNSNQVYGDGVQFEPGSIMDALDKGTFVNNHAFDVKNNPAVFATAAYEATSRFLTEAQISNTTISGSAQVKVGTPGSGVIGSSASISSGVAGNRTGSINENETYMQYLDAINKSESSYDGRMAMQEIYNNKIDYAHESANMPSQEDVSQYFKDVRSKIEDDKNDSPEIYH